MMLSETLEVFVSNYNFMRVTWVKVSLHFTVFFTFLKNQAFRPDNYSCS